MSQPSTAVPASSTDVLATALSLRTAGVSILPADHRTKKPLNRLLPTSDDGRPVWKPFQRQIVDESTTRRWFGPGGAQSLAIIAGAVSGGMLVFDFDIDGFYEAWCALVGDLADSLPVQRTGGGGYQVFCRCPEPGGNVELAWAACESEDSGRTIAIETRGEGGYALVPPSLHPDGGRYQMISGDLTQIPLISQARADALLAAARKLDECPYTRQQTERLEREAHEAHQRLAAANRNGSAGVIDQFNAAHAIEALLERHGYTRCGERFVRPGGRSASVSIREGRSCHFSSNDPLNDGKVKSGIGVHDAFDVFTLLEHGGDAKAAVRAAADVMGLSPQRRQNPLKHTPCADETPAGNSAAGVLSMSALKGKVSQSLRVEPYRPFPTDALPRPLAQFIREAAAAIGCDDSFIALPLLVGLAIAIGSTRRIRLKWDWLEFPIVWAVIVASSGQRKSPGFYAAMRPLHDMQHRLMEEHRAAMADYKQQLVAHRQALAECKQSGGAPPEEPQRPVLKRLVVNDTTIEALALILEENPRGLGVVRDELSAWLASFNQYKAGRGSDASQWLELHRGGLLIVDRKTAERRTIYVQRAAASIGGTIQPGVIKRGYGKEQFENGMVARTLFAMPPARQREWTDQHVEAYTRDRIAEIYAKLAALDFDGQGEPIDLPLTPAAQEQFIRFVNEHGAEQARLGDERLEAAWSKLEGYAARLALIVHLVRCAVNDSTLETHTHVAEHSITCGVRLARWFGHEARRVYADMGMTDEDRQRHGLVELIRRQGGSITPRELTRHCRRYRSTDSAEQALQELVGMRVGDWDHTTPGPAGGRPQKHFVLCSTSADIDETPESDAPAGVSSAAGAESGGFVGAVDDPSEDEEREAVRWADGGEGVAHG